jgi:teichuronic acid biosynthesis glycosyltransferase TuaC
VVAVSAPLRDAAVELGASSSRVDVVPNGIDRARFRPQDRAAARHALGLPIDGVIVLYIGNIERHKGSLDLVRAFAVLAQWRKNASLLMVGDGAAKTDCQKLAIELGVDVSFVGARPHDEIPQWIAACDVFALPSWNEGTPNVVLEALACGRRVVATAVGGTPDVITSETLGILVPPRDPQALAIAIERALSLAYDASVVSAALNAPDWAESAQYLHASLAAACDSGARARAALHVPH